MKKIILMLLVISCTSINAKNMPLKTVEHVELKKYLGTWYEIARFDQKFQKGCTATKANYSLLKNGDIKVLNECRLNSPDGELKRAEGRAWIKDKKTNAKLKVQFFLKNLKIPFLAGNYWILDLDKNYQNVLIGDPSREYLWILSRNKNMDKSTYLNLVDKAEELKFDTSKLIKTIH